MKVIEMTHNEHDANQGQPQPYPPQPGAPQPAGYQPPPSEQTTAYPVSDRPNVPGDEADRTSYMPTSSTSDPYEFKDPITGGPADHSFEPPVSTPEPQVAGARMSKFGGYLLGLVRILLGWQFLWAFLDKTFGFGRSTASGDAWIHGGRPTAAYLAGVTGPKSDNPFKSFFKIFEGHAWADWVFMVGLVGIGLCLMVGLGMWIACIAGAVLLLLMYAASWPIAQNPFLDEHLLNAIILIALLACNAGAYLGLGKRWKHRVRRTATV